MVVVFSFDDGRDDAYIAFQILKKYHLKGSFHITTGFVDGTFKTDDFGINRKPISIKQLKEMNESGMDISSHGDRHIMEKDDFRVSYEKLNKFGIRSKKVGFSVPNSNCSQSETELFISYNKDILSYIRKGRSKKCYSFLSKMNYILYHLTHFQFFYNNFNKHNIMKKVCKFSLNSMVVLSDSKSKNIINFIKKYDNQNNILILMFHSICDAPSNKWEYSLVEFEKICSYVSFKQSCCSLKELVEGIGANEQ